MIIGHNHCNEELAARVDDGLGFLATHVHVDAHEDGPEIIAQMREGQSQTIEEIFLRYL